MNGYREDNPCCYFHPKEVLVGVCPLCLNERLLVLASKQGHHSSSSSSSRGSHGHQGVTQRKPINLPKIFAFSSSLLNRLEFRHWRSDNSEDHDASTSQEDSFISIKFEDNGAASWEKGTVSKVSLEHCSMSWNHHTLTKDPKEPKEINKSVIERAKPRAPVRWRKRIGHLFHLIRLKRSTACHVGTKVEGIKVRKGWIRSLTKRKAKE